MFSAEVTQYAQAGLVLAAVMMAMLGVAVAVERVRRGLRAMAQDLEDARGILEQVQYDLWEDEYTDDPTLVRAARDVDQADSILWHRASTLRWCADRLDWRWWREEIRWRIPQVLFMLHLKKREPWFIENEEGELIYND